MSEPSAEPDTVPFPRAAPAEDRTAELEDRLRKLEAALAERAAPPTPPAVPAPPQGAILHPPQQLPPDPARNGWLLTQLLGELRLALRMYFDPRYRISRTAQFVFPGILCLLVFNYFFFSNWVSIAVVSPVFERGLAVLFGVIGYKVLTRELARYRDVLDYLARYGHR